MAAAGSKYFINAFVEVKSFCSATAFSFLKNDIVGRTILVLQQFDHPQLQDLNSVVELSLNVVGL